MILGFSKTIPGMNKPYQQIQVLRHKNLFVEFTVVESIRISLVFVKIMDQIIEEY